MQLAALEPLGGVRIERQSSMARTKQKNKRGGKPPINPDAVRMQEFLDRVQSVPVGISELPDDEMARWDDKDPKRRRAERERVKEGVIEQMVKHKMGGALVIDSEARLVAMGREEKKDKWTFLELEGDFRMPADEVVEGFPD
jgi:hypothetical protein